MNHRMQKNPKLQDDNVLTNAMLYNCFYVLRHIYHECTQRHGFNVVNKDVIYEKLKAFKDCHGQSNYYVVSLDIQKCFDSIDCTQLYKMLEQLLIGYNSSDFIIHKYNIAQYHSLRNQLHHRSIRYVTQSNLLHFHDVSTQLSRYYQNCILTDGVHYPVLSTASMLKILKQHLFHHKISYAKQAYESVKGLPQGSVLSTLLCNIFYGSLENEAYSKDVHSLQDSTLVMRQVDDYLIVSTSIQAISKLFYCLDIHEVHAGTFVQSLLLLLQMHGSNLNILKSKANCDISIDILDQRESLTKALSTIITWCGLDIDSRSLEVINLNRSYKCLKNPC